MDEDLVKDLDALSSEELQARIDTLRHREYLRDLRTDLREAVPALVLVGSVVGSVVAWFYFYQPGAAEIIRHLALVSAIMGIGTVLFWTVVNLTVRPVLFALVAWMDRRAARRS